MHVRSHYFYSLGTLFEKFTANLQLISFCRNVLDPKIFVPPSNCFSIFEAHFLYTVFYFCKLFAFPTKRKYKFERYFQIFTCSIENMVRLAQLKPKKKRCSHSQISIACSDIEKPLTHVLHFNFTISPQYRSDILKVGKNKQKKRNRDNPTN